MTHPNAETPPPTTTPPTTQRVGNQPTYRRMEDSLLEPFWYIWVYVGNTPA